MSAVVDMDRTWGARCGQTWANGRKVSETARLKSTWHELIQMASRESLRVAFLYGRSQLVHDVSHPVRGLIHSVVPMLEHVCCPSQRPKHLPMAHPYEDTYELRAIEAPPRDARSRLVRV